MDYNTYLTRLQSTKEYTNKNGYNYKRKTYSYKCNFCNFAHYQKNSVIKHIKNNHQNDSPLINQEVQHMVKKKNTETKEKQISKTKINFKEIPRKKKEEPLIPDDNNIMPPKTKSKNFIDEIIEWFS